VTIKNLSASVHARLQNHARATKRPFQELLQYYAMERFLYLRVPRVRDHADRGFVITEIAASCSPRSAS